MFYWRLLARVARILLRVFVFYVFVHWSISALGTGLLMAWQCFNPHVDKNLIDRLAWIVAGAGHAYGVPVLLLKLWRLMFGPIMPSIWRWYYPNEPYPGTPAPLQDYCI